MKCVVSSGHTETSSTTNVNVCGSGSGGGDWVKSTQPELLLDDTDPLGPSPLWILALLVVGCNGAEYQALVYGLDVALEYQPESLDIYTDSELLVKQMNGEYKTKNSKSRSIPSICAPTTQTISQTPSASFWTSPTAPRSD